MTCKNVQMDRKNPTLSARVPGKKPGNQKVLEKSCGENHVEETQLATETGEARRLENVSGIMATDWLEVAVVAGPGAGRKAQAGG